MAANSFFRPALRSQIESAAGAGGYVLRNARLSSAVTKTDIPDDENTDFFLADVSVENGRILAIKPVSDRTTTKRARQRPAVP